MNNTNTGGTAFPGVEYKQPGGVGVSVMTIVGGMTLRDYFAAKAMQGLLAGITPTTVWSHDEAAETAYNVAASMLKAREA
jgi:hypothetical protein